MLRYLHMYIRVGTKRQLGRNETREQPISTPSPHLDCRPRLQAVPLIFEPIKIDIVNRGI